MDLLDNINNIPRKSTEETVNYEIKGKKGKSRLLFDFEKSCTFSHGDKITNLIKARILNNYKKGSSASPDSAKYICLEIPEFISLKELIKSSIFDTLEKLGKLTNLVDSEYNHLGIIYINQDGKYELYSPTNEVLEYVKNNLNREIIQSQKLFTERIRGQQFKTRISEPVNEYIKNKQIINERKKNVFLEEQYRYKIGNEVYTDYIGTDVTEGKLLRINRLNKIDGTNDENLYSAFIEKKEDTEEQEETIMIGQTPKGFPILFTLTNTLEEYIKDNDEKQIVKILQLITDLPKDRLNVNEILYIGGIDEQGNIYRKIESCSKQIKQKINEEKSKYKKSIDKKELSII